MKGTWVTEAMPLLEWLIVLDRTLFIVLNTTFANPILDLVFINGTEARFWIIPGVVAAFFYIRSRRKEALVVLGLALLTVAITDPLSARVLKPLFHRYRPCHPDFFVDGGRFLCGMRRSLSFPSVHSVNIFAQAALLASFYPRRAWIYFLFACFIGYSRIYVGVHYPGDVAAGAAFGTGVGVIVALSYRAVCRHLSIRRGSLPAS